MNLMTHSLVFLLRHTVCHFLFKPQVLNLTALQNPGSQMVSLLLVKGKNSLYKQFQLNPTALNKLRYNEYRNKYNFLIKLAKKKFFHDKLLSVSSDLRKTWSVIKQIISEKEPELRFNNMKDSSGSYSNPTQIVGGGSGIMNHES